jgi:hypothetical protein
MVRLQWFTFSGINSAALRELASRMLDDRYVADRSWGFLVDDVRPSSISGRFIEKELVVSTVEDPFGNTQRFEHTIFQKTRFRIDLTRHWMEIQDAPRTLASFFSRLSEHSQFKASVEPILFQPLAWFHVFRKTARDAVMTKAVIDDFELVEKVMVRAAVFSDADVEAHLQKLVGKRKVTASAIQICFTKDSEIYRASVSASGRIRILTAAHEAALDVIRAAVESR